MAAPPAFVFHTAFCASTLLGRCLAQPGETFLLIEPLALLDLAQAARRAPVEQETVNLVLRLLAKPQHNERSVLIKPSNLVNNLIGRLLDSHHASRGVVVSSGVEDFLISFIKKPDETRRNLPRLLATLAHGSDYLERAGVAQVEDLDFWRLSVLVWHVQRFLLDQWAADDRLRFVATSRLLEHPHETAAACADHLGIAPPQSSHIDHALGRHAKEPTMDYGRRRREQEADMIRARYGEQIRGAVSWLKEHVEPCVDCRRPKPLEMQPPA